MVGLGLRAPEAGPGAWGGTREVEGASRDLGSRCHPSACRMLSGPFHRCNNSGRKILGSAPHPAPIPAPALKICGGLGRLPALSGLEFVSVQ